MPPNRIHPHYDLLEFLASCSDKFPAIIITARAWDTARRDFHFKVKSEAIDFLADKGESDFVLQNSKPWENNPSKLETIMVDAYEFEYSRFSIGYLAIRKNPKTGDWVIKSLKKSEQSFSPLENNLDLIQFKKTLPEEGNENE